MSFLLTDLWLPCTNYSNFIIDPSKHVKMGRTSDNIKTNLASFAHVMIYTSTPNESENFKVINKGRINKRDFKVNRKNNLCYKSYQVK